MTGYTVTLRSCSETSGLNPPRSLLPVGYVGQRDACIYYVMPPADYAEIVESASKSVPKSVVLVEANAG
jgi:hypothetical protein